LCISGTAIYQKTSFLADRLGEKVAGTEIFVSDDGLMPGMLGSAPFDSEGVPSQKTKIIERGILKNYLCNTYSAKKLNIRSTGNADGNGIGPHNFYLHKGPDSPETIISTLDKGLILIRTLGHGLNPINGDMSRGAFGLWVEKGEIVYPVSEITISGNLGQILNSIEMIGNDLEFRGPIAGPTIKISELTLAGA
jgi:PmbA protein